MADEPANTPEEEETSQSPSAAAEPAETAAVEPAETATAEADTASTETPLDIGSEAEPEPRVEIDVEVAPTVRGKIDRFGTAIGTGRRKTAVARVRVKNGNGQLSINGRELTDYFPLERDQEMVLAPLKATGMQTKVDVWVRVTGGGTTGQTGAVVLGIARALEVQDHSLHHTLAEGGFLTRDGRMVERKKYGYRKARRSFQFSKR